MQRYVSMIQQLIPNLRVYRRLTVIVPIGLVVAPVLNKTAPASRNTGAIRWSLDWHNDDDYVNAYI